MLNETIPTPDELSAFLDFRPHSPTLTRDQGIQMSKPTARRKISGRPDDIDTGIEHDPTHHLTGPFLPQTPLGSNTPVRQPSPPPKPQVSPWIRWAIDPLLALRILVVPVVAYLNWELLTPLLTKHVQPALIPSLKSANVSQQMSNPFAPFFLLSNPVSTSSPADPRYAKSWGDLIFIAYHIVLLSCVRQTVTVKICRPIARYFGIKKETKLDRFGEQGYAVVYFAFMGAWGYRIMKELPTFWYRTEYFWIGMSFFSPLGCHLK
ncbi:sphingosine N-acyltransferase lag1 [Marasmius sp. AFHP31]|nr:sphingosine N-acyltransferase lag1 [Marasmius sp. AFHP31]